MITKKESKLFKSVTYYTDTKYNFQEVFNKDNGVYIRSDVLDEKGNPTGKDPFMRSFPSLLDIGIMGGCTASKTCVCDCYQGGKPCNPDNDMTLENYKRIIDEGKEKGLQQVALGGAGNPNDHKYFKEILEYTTANGIVPNYTTAGIGLTDEMAKLTKKHCGAVAVSWHKTSYSIFAIEKFLLFGCKTSIHYVLSRKTIHDAITLLETGELPYTIFQDCSDSFSCNDNHINAVIFLLYKPVGLGKQEDVLSIERDEAELKTFFKLVGQHKNKFQIGFDSCTIPGVIKYSEGINPDSMDTCEGARFSAYITPDMKLLPCSFDNQEQRWAYDLEGHTIEEGWNSQRFGAFRFYQRYSCPECEKRESCMGGCPIRPEIVLCDHSPSKEHSL